VIIRTHHDQLVLITQPDHAALAGRIMSAWRQDGLPESPQRVEILLAINRHDDGWIENDGAPLVDAVSGEILDYVHAPDDVRRSIWPRSVERLAAHPYASALVAQHALHLFDRYRAEPGWEPFFTEMESLRAAQLAAAHPISEDDLRRDYFFVRMGDLLSLQFCDDWREPQRHGDYESVWDGRRLTVVPDPFDGERIALEVPTRPLPRQRYDDAGARRAFQSAPVVTAAGVISGS
jgi:hypothetical protein